MELPAVQPVRAEVLAVLNSATVRVVLAPGEGPVDGGIHCDLAADLIAPSLRLPGTMLWVQLDGAGRVLSASRRDE
jgi:hypothetical protein